MNNENFNSKKPLVIPDDNGFLFKQEMLCGETGCFIDLDGILHHPKRGWVVFEYLLCSEEQMVNPHTSHPNRYWHKNKMKFIRLFQIAKLLQAELFFVNYAKSGTMHEDKVGVIKVIDLCETGILKDVIKKFTRKEFSDWLRQMNLECQNHYYTNVNK